MHELSLMQDLVEVLGQRCKGARITRVILEVGRHSAVDPDAMRFCFDVCAEGTIVQGALLSIALLDGAELRVSEVEVEVAEPGLP